MLDDISLWVLSRSEEIASFVTLYKNSQNIFEQVAASAQNPVGIRRLRPNEMFLPEDARNAGGVGSNAAPEEDTEMKDAEDQVIENTKDEEIDDVLAEVSGRLLHRDVTVKVLPGGTPAKRIMKVCGS
jgi:23S rRNA maturation-related 3'-5' exoribonuclease YhaM